MKALFITFVTSILFTFSASAKTYTLDNAHSSIGFSVKHLGLFPVKGSFKKFSGTMDINEKTGEIKNLNVKIDVDSIYTNEDDRDAHLKSKDFFNVRNEYFDIIEKNRFITFKVGSVSVGDKTIKGKLKILKTTKTVKLKSKIAPIRVKGKIAKLGIEANGEVDRTDFGLTWQKEGTGLLAKAAGKFVGDDVELNINVVAIPAKKK